MQWKRNRDDLTISQINRSTS